jgi:hypothetical protein
MVLVSLRDAIQALLAADPEERQRLHQDSNIEAAEAAMTALIRVWQTRRYDKAARLLRKLAAHLAVTHPGQGAPAQELAASLSRLAAGFADAPSISLEDKAA